MNPVFQPISVLDKQFQTKLKKIHKQIFREINFINDS